jgi:hypothetical protein
MAVQNADRALKCFHAISRLAPRPPSASPLNGTRGIPVRRPATAVTDPALEVSSKAIRSYVVRSRLSHVGTRRLARLRASPPVNGAIGASAMCAAELARKRERCPSMEDCSRSPSRLLGFTDPMTSLEIRCQPRLMATPQPLSPVTARLRATAGVISRSTCRHVDTSRACHCLVTQLLKLQPVCKSFPPMQLMARGNWLQRFMAR